MADPLSSAPDVLVLGAGGTLGIAWLRGMVAGIEDAGGPDLRRAEYLIGTSAGSYVAAALAAGRRVDAAGTDPGTVADARAIAEALPDDAPGRVRRAVGAGTRTVAAVTAPVVPWMLAATRPGGAVVRAALLRAAPRSRDGLGDLRRHTDEFGARFDGRLRVVAVDRRRGSRVVFGAPGAPRATVGEAVLASCSVPWLFPPVTIGGREYVDGGVWSLSNLDVAPAGRGSEVLALLPTAGRGTGRGAAALARTAAQAAALAERQALRARGASVRVVVPDRAAIEAMGPNLMAPGPRAAVFAAGRAQGRRLVLHG